MDSIEIDWIYYHYWLSTILYCIDNPIYYQFSGYDFTSDISFHLTSTTTWYIFPFTFDPYPLRFWVEWIFSSINQSDSNISIYPFLTLECLVHGNWSESKLFNAITSQSTPSMPLFNIPIIITSIVIPISIIPLYSLTLECLESNQLKHQSQSSTNSTQVNLVHWIYVI